MKEESQRPVGVRLPLALTSAAFVLSALRLRGGGRCGHVGTESTRVEAPKPENRGETRGFLCLLVVCQCGEGGVEPVVVVEKWEN